MGNSTRGKQSFRSRSTAEGAGPKSSKDVHPPTGPTATGLTGPTATGPTGPAYPIFEVGRRRFLRQLGLVAGGSLGFVVIGCTLDDDHASLGGKADSSFVPRPADMGPPDTSGGIPDAPPALGDQQIDRFQAIDINIADGYPSQPLDIATRRPDLGATRPDLATPSDSATSSDSPTSGSDAGSAGSDSGSRP